jgi:hypothetical protein
MILLALLLWQGAGSTQKGERALPEPGPFLEGVRAHLRSDRLLLSQYVYTERRRECQLDRHGNIKKTTERVYEVYPSLEEGQSYTRLISKDGKALSTQELGKQDRAHDKKVRERALKLEREGTDEKFRRQAKEAEEKQQEEKVVGELFRLYRISLVGREEIEGESAIRVTFEPDADYRPAASEVKLLKKVAGTAWFGEKDYELIRLEARVIDNITLGLGILARLNKGATAVFRRRRVNGEIWLPAEARFAGTARILLLKGMRIESVSEFSDYRKFTVTTSTTLSQRKLP